jgi:hypothetical protein
MNDRLEPRIRILLGSSIAIGPGKAALLEAIGETGSIAAAGAADGDELPTGLVACQDHECVLPGAAD